MTVTEPTAMPPEWAIERHPAATGWRPDGERRWRATLPDVFRPDLLVLVDAAGKNAASYALDLADRGQDAAEVAEIVFRRMQDELDHAALPFCAKPDCGRKAPVVFTAAEAGPLAGVTRAPGERIHFCNHHGHDVFVAASGAGVAPWLKPDAIHMDPLGEMQAAAYAGDEVAYAAARERLLRPIRLI